MVKPREHAQSQKSYRDLSSNSINVNMFTSEGLNKEWDNISPASRLNTSSGRLKMCCKRALLVKTRETKWCSIRTHRNTHIYTRTWIARPQGEKDNQ